MPKSLDKTKGAQKRRKPTINTTDPSDGSDAGVGTARKKKKVQKKQRLDPGDGIEMSKQLAGKVRTSRTTRSTRPVRASSKNDAPRLCGNGTPMPSLADLEKMYEDSDYDTDTEQKPTVPVPPDRPKTPDALIPDLPPEKVMSIASKVFEILESGAIEILDDDGPPPPVIPQKRPKKSEVPYIVGCTERPQVPQRPPRIRFGVGDIKYGVECPCESSDDECECPKKRRRRGDGASISKSIFNAKSEEIAANLIANERLESLFRKKSSSPDSCSTVSYECTVSPSPAPRPFHPKPSCSNDSKTILENERMFSESLTGEDLSNSSQNDIEILNPPLETIEVCDETIPIPKREYIPDEIENGDDFCMIVEPEIKKKNASLIDLDDPKYDFYNNINTYDLTESYDNDICEVIDVDDIIAQNQALLSKYRKEETARDVVTSVDLSNIGPGPDQRGLKTEVVISSNTSAGPDRSLSTPVDNVPCAIVQNTNTNTVQGVHNDSNNNMIADVVTNFFNQGPSNNSCETVDLTSVQASLINKITSWMASIDNFIRLQSAPQDAQVVQVQPNAQNRTHEDSVIEIPSPSVPAVNNHVGDHDYVQIMSTNNVAPPAPARTRRSKKNQPCGNPIINPTGPPAPASPQPAPSRSMECPICMDSLSNKSIVSTMCGHVFCLTCIKETIRASGKRCPTCRKVLKGVGYHQLFL